MEDMALVIMEKEKETGFLGRELGSYSLKADMSYIEKVFAYNEDGKMIVNLYLTVPGEFEDWEFNAILDNYNLKLYDEKVISIDEDEDSYNPGWIVKFPFLENDDAMEEKINEILQIHSEEANRVLEEIKGLEDEYRK